MTKADAETDATIMEVEDFIHQRRLERMERSFVGKLKKAIDFLNALRYHKNIAKIKQKKEKAMDNNPTKTATKKVSKKSTSNVKNTVASVLAAPFIIVGVASLVQSNIPYFEYVLGAIVAGFIVHLLVKE